MTEANEKKFYLSKTFWVNIIALVASVTGAFGLDLDLNPETQTAVVTAIMAIVNLVLRFTTKDKVTL